MRLDKFVSKALGQSRSQVKKLIVSGQISVDQFAQKDAGYIVDLSEVIEYQGCKLEVIANHYLLLNKPKNYICSSIDEQYPSALKLLNLSSTKHLHFAGRLDADTSGLVLITDDGQWSHRIASPRHKQIKVYQVDLAEPLSGSDIALLEKGILLKDAKALTKPAKVTRLSDRQILLAITEGRYHQVKRMIGAVGNRVTNLHRQSIGCVTLEDELVIGQWRKLTDQEIDSF